MSFVKIYKVIPCLFLIFLHHFALYFFGIMVS